MLIRNKTAEAREIAVGDFSAFVEAGDTIEVPDEIANGTEPTGNEGAPDYDPGRSGLLAQEDVWDASNGGRPTVDDVLADVGDDPDRARTALALENQSDRPRKTLVSRLEEIAAATEENI